MPRAIRSILKLPRRLINAFRKKKEKEPNATVFPFLLLPNTAQMKVVQNMDLYEISALSVCSKATKSLVQSLKIRNMALHVRFEYSIRISIYQWGTMASMSLWFHRDENEGVLTSLFGQFFVKTYCGEKLVDWKTIAGFNGLREWILHFLDIFDRNGIDYLTITDGKLDFNLIKECLNGITFKKLFVSQAPTYDVPLSDDDYENISTSFLPRRELQMVRDGFHVMDPKILTQNIGMFKAGHKITLNHLLLANCEFLEISGNHLTVKDINRFLKLWKNGCNPRMKYISLYSHRQNHLNNIQILKDIEFVPINVVREYPQSFYGEFGPKSQRVYHGGFDIRRNNGTMATIRFDRDGLEIFVWD